jgi:hypothetical protein
MYRLGRSCIRLFAALVVCLSSGACAATFTTENIGPCSPEYSISHPEVGNVFIRQGGRGQAIQWGAYLLPKYKVGTHFVLTVYAGGVKIDSKNQSYEPHGSINANRALKYSGKLLEISGTATHESDVLTFSAKCMIA